MKICISGSMRLIDELEALSAKLNTLGHEAVTPCRGNDVEIKAFAQGMSPSGMKAMFVADHLEKIRNTDALLIANLPKDGVDGYIGQSTILEAAMAYALGKDIYILREPCCGALAVELKALNALIIWNDLNGIADHSRR